jgi:hypothetical protein
VSVEQEEAVGLGLKNHVEIFGRLIDEKPVTNYSRAIYHRIKAVVFLINLTQGTREGRLICHVNGVIFDRQTAGP